MRFFMSVESEQAEYKNLIDNILELFKGRSYGYVKEALNDCMDILEDTAKVP